MHAHITLSTPIGDLTVFEDDGALVAVDWGRDGGGGSETPLLKRARQAFDAYFAGKKDAFDGLPLRPGGTDHQRAVWRAMQAIPYGKTASFADLARKIKSGPRAVGTACGKNPLPIVIPCHRVLGSNGIGGYSGGDGLATKRQLLALEGYSFSER
jgi:methylated-DNA-[protein]-cysteine S-methyltransferase